MSYLSRLLIVHNNVEYTDNCGKQHDFMVTMIQQRNFQFHRNMSNQWKVITYGSRVNTETISMKQQEDIFILTSECQDTC